MYLELQDKESEILSCLRGFDLIFMRTTNTLRSILVVKVIVHSTHQ